MIESSLIPSALLRWHASLDHHRGDRAKLRRIESHPDAVFVPHFHALVRGVEASGLQEIEWLAAWSMVAVHATHSSGRLGQQFNRAGKGLSELRFGAILDASGLSDLAGRLRNAAMLLRGPIDLIETADLIHYWPSHRVRTRLALDYWGSVEPQTKEANSI